MRGFNLTNLPRKLHGRFLPGPLTNLRWSELSFGRSSFAIAHVPALRHHHPPMGRASLEQPTMARRESRRTTNIFDPPPRTIRWRRTREISMTIITLIPDKTYPTATILRIATVVAAMLMVQEGRQAEADGLRPEPEPEVVEGVCDVPLDQKTIRFGGAMPGRITRAMSKAVVGVMEQGFRVTVADTGGDEEENQTTACKIGNSYVL